MSLILLLDEPPAGTTNESRSVTDQLKIGDRLRIAVGHARVDRLAVDDDRLRFIINLVFKDGTKLADQRRLAVTESLPADRLGVRDTKLINCGIKRTPDGMRLGNPAPRFAIGEKKTDALRLGDVRRFGVTETLPANGLKISSSTREAIGLLRTDKMRIADTRTVIKGFPIPLIDRMKIGNPAARFLIEERKTDGLRLGEAKRYGVTETKADKLGARSGHLIQALLTRLDRLGVRDSLSRAGGVITTDKLKLGDRLQRAVTERLVNGIGVDDGFRLQIEYRTRDGLKIVDTRNILKILPVLVIDRLKTGDRYLFTIGEYKRDGLAIRDVLNAEQSGGAVHKTGRLRINDIVRILAALATDDSLSIDDATQIVTGKNLTFSDRLGVRDAKRLSIGETVYEALAFADVRRQYNVGELLDDAITLTDRAIRLLGLKRSDTFGVTDRLKRLVGLKRAADRLGVRDVAALIQITPVIRTDKLRLHTTVPQFIIDLRLRDKLSIRDALTLQTVVAQGDTTQTIDVVNEVLTITGFVNEVLTITGFVNEVLAAAGFTNEK